MFFRDVLLTASLLLACSSQTSTAPASEKPGETPRDDVEEGVHDPKAGPAEAPPADCDFEVKETCYKDQEAACKAAGCQPGKCLVMESYPAQIACR